MNFRLLSLPEPTNQQQVTSPTQMTSMRMRMVRWHSFNIFKNGVLFSAFVYILFFTLPPPFKHLYIFLCSYPQVCIHYCGKVNQSHFICIAHIHKSQFVSYGWTRCNILCPWSSTSVSKNYPKNSFKKHRNLRVSRTSTNNNIYIIHEKKQCLTWMESVYHCLKA